MRTSFVNPYTFVPTVADLKRQQPAGHGKLQEDRYSGVLGVRLTVRTPLVIGGYRHESEDLQVLPRRSTPDRTVMIPGSGFLGAVRSVHETLAGGCMRVLDIGHRPVHRHPVTNAETKGLQFAVVTKVDDDGRAKQVRLCEKRGNDDGGDFARIPSGALSTANGRLPKTGDQLAGPIPSAAFQEDGTPLQRKVKLAPAEGGVAPGSLSLARKMGLPQGDSWILLVTDTKAKGDDDTVYFFAGHFQAGDFDDYEVTPEAWASYRSAVADADDMRPATLDADEGGRRARKPKYRRGDYEYEPVPWPAHSEDPEDLVAERLRARPYLHVGQPVWVKTRQVGLSREVTEIRLSLLWRYPSPAGLSVGERAGAAQPCDDPQDLCWSCRIFGSADTSGREADDLARQDGYRGHVRFEDLLAEGEVKKRRWHLAPLSKPHPSAGQFYLESRRSEKKLAENTDRPAANWGSVADDRPRPLRGRKFYWRTTNSRPWEEEHPRGEKRKHQSENLCKEVELIPSGTEFTGRVWFENLSEAEYGSLLAALNPRVLHEVDEQEEWPWKGTVTSIGGGKPFGFGAVNVTVESKSVQSGGARYLGEPGGGPDADEAVEAFRDAQPPGLVQWNRVRRVLTFGYVQDDLVWYPAYKGPKGEEDYDKSFEFFARNNGLEQEKGRDHPLKTLPDAIDSPDRQVIEWEPADSSDADGQEDEENVRG